MKKHLLIVVILLIALFALVAWQIVRSNNESSWKRAEDHFARAEYAKAKEELKSLDMPSSPERLRIYGQTMLATRDLDKSLEAYNKLYDLEKDPSVNMIIGNIYNEQKKYDEAIKRYQEVITANAANTQAYVNMATVYRLQNKPRDAVAIASEAVDKNPSNIVLHELKVAMLMDDKSSEEYTKAVDALRELDPDNQLLQTLNSQ